MQGGSLGGDVEVLASIVEDATDSASVAGSLPTSSTFNYRTHLFVGYLETLYTSLE